MENGLDSMPVEITDIGFARTMTGYVSASGSRSWSEEPRADSIDLLPEEASRVTDFLSRSAAVSGATTSSLLLPYPGASKPCKTCYLIPRYSNAVAFPTHQRLSLALHSIFVRKKETFQF